MFACLAKLISLKSFKKSKIIQKVLTRVHLFLCTKKPTIKVDDVVNSLSLYAFY